MLNVIKNTALGTRLLGSEPFTTRKTDMKRFEILWFS